MSEIKTRIFKINGQSFDLDKIDCFFTSRKSIRIPDKSFLDVFRKSRYEEVITYHAVISYNRVNFDDVSEWVLMKHAWEVYKT